MYNAVMAHTSKNPNVKDRTNRAKLPVKSDPYWHLIAQGQHLGYRKTGEMRGTWIARYYTPERGRRFQALGAADDTVPANGTHVFSFQDALAAAQEWIAKTARSDRAGVHIGPYTVKDAAEDWLTTQTSPTSGTHVRLDILPALGNIELKKLTKAILMDWLQALGRKPTVRSLSPKSKVPFDIDDPEVRRKRQDTANRVLRSLKALLNHARDKGHIDTDAAWVTVAEFPKVAKQRTEYLTVDQGARFIEVCPEDFRKLVQAALFTGCRYNELCTMPVSAYDANTQTLWVMQGKTRLPKVSYLAVDEAAFFEGLTKGKQLGDLMFLRSDGQPWRKDHQKPRMKAARKAAKIEQHITFHNLRHTFASLLAMNGTQPELIQQQMGHSNPRMTQRYTHFSPSYAASTIRANKPSFATIAAPTSN
jgi:integrase